MSQFQVGEVAIIVYSALPEFPVGTEVTVLRISRRFIETHYVIHEDNLSVVYAAERCLSKKRPPQDWVKLCRLDEVRAVGPKEVA